MYQDEYGLSEILDKKAQHSMIWLAWKQDDFPAFKAFIEAFKGILNDDRYDSPFWQHRLGLFYLRYRDYLEAISHFLNGLESCSENESKLNIQSALGYCYLKTGEIKKANDHYECCLKMLGDDATIISFPYLNQLRGSLMRIKSKNSNMEMSPA